MITLTACLAPAIVSIAKGIFNSWPVDEDIDRISGISAQISKAKYDALCAEIFKFAGVDYSEPSGFDDDYRFMDWPAEHEDARSLLDDLADGSFLDREECVKLDAWFRDSGFVDSASDMSTLNAVRSVVSAAVSERGGIVVS